MCVCMLSRFSGIQLFCNPMDFSPPDSSVHRILRQEYWSGLPCPTSGNLPDLGIEPTSPMSPVLAGRFFITSATWETPFDYHTHHKTLQMLIPDPHSHPPEFTASVTSQGQAPGPRPCSPHPDTAYMALLPQLDKKGRAHKLNLLKECL